MRIPPRLARRAEALHRLIARDHVLEHARQNMVHAGAGIGGGRTLVQHEQIFGVALLHAALKDALLLPESDDALFHLGETDPA